MPHSISTSVKSPDLGMNQPNFFIVGFPKSGTTALYDFLKQHNQIFMSEVKEPYFFCTDFHKEFDRFYQNKKPIMGTKNRFQYRKLDDYLTLFSDATDKAAVGEASVHYLYSKVAAQNIYDFNPNAKIIISIRNPIDFIRSWYQWNKFDLLAEGAENISEALALEEKRKNGSFRKVKKPPVSHLFYLQMAKYNKHIKKFIQRFPNSQIKVVVFDNFAKNNIKICKSIYDFLGVDTGFTPQLKTVNPSSIPKHVFLRQILDSSYIKHTRKKLREFIPDEQFQKLKFIYDKIVYQKNNKIQIDDDLEQSIKKELKSNVTLLNRTLRSEGLISNDTNLVELWNF